MALFGLGISKNAKNKVPALPAPLPDNSFESVRLIDGEATPRRNVPAIAMASSKRLNLSLPATTAAYASAPVMPQQAERRLIVGRDISLAGEIAECEQLVVDGTIQAKLGQGKRLDISATGLFRGDANVDEADIAGRFEGELNVNRLRLRATSQFNGRVRFSVLEVDAGAQITGEFIYVTPAGGHQENTTIINFPPYQAAKSA